MQERPEDICPRNETPQQQQSTRPMAPPIHLAAVYQCESPQQADALLAGELPGYVYVRDAHPNADILAEKCQRLHGAESAVVCGSGMAALAAAALSRLSPGDRVIVSDQLYGRSSRLLCHDLARFGVASVQVDACDQAAVERALAPGARLLVVETISNPMLRVADIRALANLAHAHGAQLLVDNTFASPIVCQPLALGADLVLESLTKIMNGHSDVLLGLLCGGKSAMDRVADTVTTWGLSSGPFDCWLAARGLGTLALRVAAASHSALAAAEYLVSQPTVKQVNYPGLKSHPEHAIASRQFSGRYGHMVTFELRGGRAAADQFIRAVERIPFSPSLGDLCTTLSHPETTSHRSFSEDARRQLGITGGTIRLSVGIESRETIVESLAQALADV